MLITRASALRASDLRTLALIGLAIGTGCKKELPERVEYRFTIPEGSAVPAGAMLFGGEEQLGVVSARQSGSVTSTEVSARLSRDDKLAAVGPLSFRFPTPCGLTEPIEAVATFERPEDDQRTTMLEGKRFSIDAALDGPASAPWPKATRVWTDLAFADSEAELGQMKIREDSLRHTMVWNIDCAAEHSVKMGGKDVGELAPGAVEYLITALPDDCYVEQTLICLRDDEEGSAGAPRTLRGASIYALEAAVDLFLPQYKDCNASSERTAHVVERRDCADLE